MDNKNKKNKFSWPRLVIVTLVTMIISIGIYFFSMQYIIKNNALVTFRPKEQLIDFGKVIQKPGKLAFKDKDQLLILCLGLDENRDSKGIGHTKGSRTDTMFVVRIDKKGKKLGILSIPRDLWIYIGDLYGNQKINAAYAEAFWNIYSKNKDYEQAKNAGLIQAKKTIQDFLGIEIDHVVLLKITACKEFVDAIGGITVDVEKDMNYDDSWGKLHIHLKKGKQKLNGQEAVGYARFRHDAEGDLGRIRRQQQVMEALVKELKKPCHIMHINRLAKVLKKNIDTDINITEIIDIANVYKNFNRDKIIKGVIPCYDSWAGKVMILVPLENEKKVIVRKILKNPDDVYPDELRLVVVNASSYNDAGAKTAARLKKEGYKVVNIYDAPKDEINKKSTIIIDHFANSKGSLILQKSLCIDTKIQQGTSKENTTPPDFTVMVGDDYYDKYLKITKTTPNTKTSHYKSYYTGPTRTSKKNNAPQENIIEYEYYDNSKDIKKIETATDNKKNTKNTETLETSNPTTSKQENIKDDSLIVSSPLPTKNQKENKQTNIEIIK